MSALGSAVYGSRKRFPGGCGGGFAYTIRGHWRMVVRPDDVTITDLRSGYRYPRHFGTQHEALAFIAARERS